MHLFCSFMIKKKNHNLILLYQNYGSYLAEKERFSRRSRPLVEIVVSGAQGVALPILLFSSHLALPSSATGGGRALPTRVACRELSPAHARLCSLALWLLRFEKTILNRFFLLALAGEPARFKSLSAKRKAPRLRCFSFCERATKRIQNPNGFILQNGFTFDRKRVHFFCKKWVQI